MKRKMYSANKKNQIMRMFDQAFDDYNDKKLPKKDFLKVCGSLYRMLYK